MAQQFLEGLARELQCHLIGVHVAVLPVQGDEALVDLFEQCAAARLRVTGVAGTARVVEATVTRPRLAGWFGLARHVHLKTAVQAQLEGPHQAGDDEQAAAVIEQRVGPPQRVEARHVEASAAIFHHGQQPARVKLDRDLDLFV